jgi:hypothetical protein
MDAEAAIAVPVVAIQHERRILLVLTMGSFLAVINFSATAIRSRLMRLTTIDRQPKEVRNLNNRCQVDGLRCGGQTRRIDTSASLRVATSRVTPLGRGHVFRS